MYSMSGKLVTCVQTDAQWGVKQNVIGSVMSFRLIPLYRNVAFDKRVFDLNVNERPFIEKTRATAGTGNNL